MPMPGGAWAAAVGQMASDAKAQISAMTDVRTIIKGVRDRQSPFLDDVHGRPDVAGKVPGKPLGMRTEVETDASAFGRQILLDVP